MTKDAIVAEIRKLSPAEQREVIEAILEPSEKEYELTEEQRSELLRRYDEYKSEPEQGSDWKDVRARIERTLSP